MNSIPGRAPRADTLGIHQPKETHKRGYYLALTFGTLLSSQGADAQKLQPSGLRSRRTSKSHHTASRPEDPPHDHHQAVSRGASITIHHGSGPCTRAPAGRAWGGVRASRTPSEPEQALDPDGETRVPGDLSDGKEHPGHEGRPLVG